MAQNQVDTPSASVNRLAVRVTKDAARQIRGGHPWVFNNSITSLKPSGQTGDLAVVFDDNRNFMAIGLYDPDSAISIKILHQGKPAQIDEAFWIHRLTTAHNLRSVAFDPSHTTGYRCVHGENDSLPGLVLDRYANTYVLKLYSAAWFVHLNEILSSIAHVFKPEAVVLRLARGLQTPASKFVFQGEPLSDGRALIGDLPRAAVQFTENDLRFEAEVVHGQKTGFFLDQRDNRARVRSLAQGSRVLDVYSCTGGFSVNAAAGAAALVHSVDISAAAIEAAKRNMARNGGRPAVRACTHQVSVGDAMTVMSQMIDAGRLFDIVIVDPPSFASRQDQIDGALRAYGKLTELAVRLINPGGMLVQASCSARVSSDRFIEAVGDAAYRSGVQLDGMSHATHAVDHPDTFPQGAYLKAVFARVIPA
ncbi:MAG: class I SAM-dependent rRNA methyltransferase [Microthrixaceae bacterium]